MNSISTSDKSRSLLQILWNQTDHFRRLVIRFLIAVLAFSIVRCIFYFFNSHLLPDANIIQLIIAFAGGIRFDISSLVYVNSVFIFGFLLPFSFRRNKVYRICLKAIFFITNGLFLVLELGDARYYTYALKRSTSNLADQQSDLIRLLPQFVTDYWYLILIWSVLIFLMWILYRLTEKEKAGFKESVAIQSGIFIAGLAIFSIGARGGIQSRPITPLNAVEYISDPELAPLVSNTSLNFIHSLQQRSIRAGFYMSNLEEAKKIYNIDYQPSPSGPMRKDNVVIIMLESFGKEYVGFFNKMDPSPSPFLDSLFKEGLYFEESIANGSRSNQAVVSITTGIPSMMDDPIMISPYQGNGLSGLPEMLAKKGYQTAFFHGGNNGTFNFDQFGKKVGFQSYIGRNEYGSQKDYDGNWGVFDRPFFRFTEKEISKMNKPFLAMLFSLTSHHPYQVEEDFALKFPDMDPVLRSVLYADFALRDFFELASKEEWYERTLFVITADHVGLVLDPDYASMANYYRIPILFFHGNGSLTGVKNDVMQQIDIFPTILDYLDYPDPYVKFGQSIFDSTSTRYAFNQVGGFGQIFDKDYLLRFSGKKSMYLYAYRNDLGLKNNLLDENPEIVSRMEQKLRAVWEIHNHTIINNLLTYPALPKKN